jgi:hypothetical protein
MGVIFAMLRDPNAFEKRVAFAPGIVTSEKGGNPCFSSAT